MSRGGRGAPGGRDRGRRPPRSDRGRGRVVGGDGPAALPRDVWRDDLPVGRRPVVGVVRRKGRLLVVEPLFERTPAVALAPGPDAEPGRIVVALPGRPGGGRRSRGHRVARTVGTPDVARDVLEALLLHHGLPRRVVRRVGDEADAAAASPVTLAGPGDAVRRDLRDLPTFTVDPATARDFDDAISARPLDAGDGVRAWVHVADVAAYVRPGSALDDDARWRGTSVYVPGTVEPMLPPALSDGACSLRPGVDRPAVTVELDVVDGRVVRARVDRTLVRSDARLDYDRVDRIFAGTDRAEDPWAPALDAARRAAHELGARRRSDTDALELDTGEARITLDRDGHVDGLVVERHTESHRLIEHLMIAANEQVARMLDGRGGAAGRHGGSAAARRGRGRARGGGAPALHRVHERPAPADVRRLADQLAALGVPGPPPPDALGPDGASAAVAELARRVDERVRRTGHGRTGLSALVLRAMQQARYAPEGAGHAGLGLDHYCHFTSPIRRYPDLVAHRAVLSLVGAGEDGNAALGAAGLQDLGTWCSATEREAMHVERTADRIARAFLLERTLLATGGRGRRWEGEVTGVASAGAFVRFGDPDGGPAGEAFEGLLPVRLLGGDWWETDELGVRLLGTASGRAIGVGDPIVVTVEAVEADRGRVTLAPAAPSASR
ncbi:MAG: RNB domain-containing ribonuclease [Solirubrobacteraceae bacterium]|nr:RNB domain-containing ribonuclease [Solirubrobacteraceae bacterium]